MARGPGLLWMRLYVIFLFCFPLLVHLCVSRLIVVLVFVCVLSVRVVRCSGTTRPTEALATTNGDVAHLVERVVSNGEAAGSIPAFSNIFSHPNNKLTLHHAKPTISYTPINLPPIATVLRRLTRYRSHRPAAHAEQADLQTC